MDWEFFRKISIYDKLTLAKRLVSDYDLIWGRDISLRVWFALKQSSFLGRNESSGLWEIDLCVEARLLFVRGL